MPTPRERHPHGRAREEDPTPEGAEVPSAQGEPLVWPPPEHEIDDLQVIELEPFSTLPAEPVMPGGVGGAVVPAATTAAAPARPQAAAAAEHPVAPAPPASALPDLSTHDADDDAFDRLRPDPVRRGPDGGAPPPAAGPVSPPARPSPHPDAGPPAVRAGRASAPPARVPVASPLPGDRHGAFRGRVVLVAGLLAAFAAGWGLASRARAPQEVARQTDAILQVQSTPPGARVLLDGALLGEAPIRARIAPGRHVLEVRGASASRRVEIEARAGVELAWSVEVGAPAPPQP